VIVYLQYVVKTSNLYGSKAVINECRLEGSCNTDISTTCLYYESVLNAKTLSFLVIVVT